MELDMPVETGAKGREYAIRATLLRG